MNTKKTLLKEDIVKLLDLTDDCSVTIDPTSSQGFEDVLGDNNLGSELVITRADLEKLISTSKNIAFSSFHSSGINNAGNHVSA